MIKIQGMSIKEMVNKVGFPHFGTYGNPGDYRCPVCGSTLVSFLSTDNIGTDNPHYKKGGVALTFRCDAEPDGHIWTEIFGDDDGIIRHGIVAYSKDLPKFKDLRIGENIHRIVYRRIVCNGYLATLKKERPKKKEQPKWKKKSFSYPALDTDKIKLLMIKSSLNYRDLAKLSGIAESALRGVLDYGKKPHTSTMGKIANGLQVDLTEIIKEREE